MQTTNPELGVGGVYQTNFLFFMFLFYDKKINQAIA